MADIIQNQQRACAILLFHKGYYFVHNIFISTELSPI
jgi:hypothetical protein